jgi:adenosine deaminase
LRDIPKTEIHLHLEACLSKDSLKKLLLKNNIKISDEDFEQKFVFSDLNGFIQLFFFIQSSIKDESDFSILIDSLGQYMKKDNIIYTEVYLAPTKFLQNGLDFDKIIDNIIQSIRVIKAQEDRDIKLLIDVSRTFGKDNALNNLNRVLKLNYTEVIGIGLGGAELLGPAKDYEEVFKIARQAGLRVVAHAGEDDGPWSVWDAIKFLKVERIGHGTSAIQDPDLMKYVRDNKIPFEVCITSNIFTGKYVREEENHPVRQFYDSGIIVTLNTDDPEIFDVRLSDEYLKLYDKLNFSVDEIIEIVKNSVLATFNPNKEELWYHMKREIDKLRKIYEL